MKIVLKALLLVVLSILHPMLPVAQEVSWRELTIKYEILFQQGRYEEAVSLAKKTLEMAERTFGCEHPNVGRSLNNLAFDYHQLGKDAEAEPLYKESLEIAKKIFGPEHINVAISIGNLAANYTNQGKYIEAEALHKRALALV
jgi:tetratricopeptide (TPR) repeat protein